MHGLIFATAVFYIVAWHVLNFKTATDSTFVLFFLLLTKLSHFLLSVHLLLFLTLSIFVDRSFLPCLNAQIVFHSFMYALCLPYTK